MKINDISAYLNEAYERLVDTDIQLDTDLTNIVDFGTSITSDSTFDDTFMSKISSVISKITKTIVHETTCETPTPSVFVTVSDYNRAVEHIIVDVPDFVMNETYSEDTNTFDKLFGEELPEYTATYFNSVISATNKVTLSKQMYIDSWSSDTAFNAFWSGVLNRIEAKAKYAKSVLAYATFRAKVCDSVHSNNKSNVVQLTPPTDTDYTEFISTIRKTVRNMKDFNAYANDGYVDSTPSEHLHLAILGDVYDKMTVSKAYTFNDKFLDIPVSNIEVLNNFGDTTSIDNITATIKANTEGNETIINNIVAVLYDDRGAVAYGDSVYVDSQPIRNTKGKINFFYMYDYTRCVVRAYKCVVFTKNGGTDVTLNSPIE